MYKNKKVINSILIGSASLLLLTACSDNDNKAKSSNSANSSDQKVVLSDLSTNKQKIAVNNLATAYLKQKGNLLAIQANKQMEINNHKNKTNYPQPYKISADGNYWSWYINHFLPTNLINQILNAHKDDGGDNDYAKSFGSTNATLAVQTMLMTHNINHGVNYNILGNIMGINFLDYQSNDSNTINNINISNNLKNNAKINNLEVNYLKSIAKDAHAANKKVINYNKTHTQKMSIPYIKYSDGLYWSWLITHNLPDNIIDYIYQKDRDLYDNDDVNTSMNIKQANIDLQYNLMQHGVSYGVNFSVVPAQLQQKIISYQNN